MIECEGCNGEGTVCLPDGTGGYAMRDCASCAGTGDVAACERCKAAPIYDADAGLCYGCVEQPAVEAILNEYLTTTKEN